MKTYEEFREELKSAYPITHGELKLPIAVNMVFYCFNLSILNGIGYKSYIRLYPIISKNL